MLITRLKEITGVEKYGLKLRITGLITVKNYADYGELITD